MRRAGLIGVFESEKDLMAAVRALSEAGLAIHDVQTPYFVHGLDRAAGLKRSRLGWVCAVAGLGTAAAMFGFQHWASAVSWPINVGGKPFSSGPAFVPVTFEAGVLAAALATVLAFFIVARLYPGKKPSLLDPRVTDDRFVVLVAAPGSGPQRDRAVALLGQHGAAQIRRSRHEGGRR